MNFKVTFTKNGETETTTADKWDLGGFCERLCSLGYEVKIELA